MQKKYKSFTKTDDFQIDLFLFFHAALTNHLDNFQSTCLNDLILVVIFPAKVSLTCT